MRRLRASYHLAGFTLLEMSIVLLIIGTLVGAGVTVFANSIAQEQEEITFQRLYAIQDALLKHRKAFHAIPCPSDITLAISATEFGRGEVSNTAGTDCDAGVGTYTPNYDIGSGVWGGGVPVRTLKLPDEFAFDGWGRRFTYFVDNVVTTELSFQDSTIDTAVGDLLIEDNTNATIAANVLYAIISHGPNGHGAYGRNGTVRVNAGSTNTNEQDNCGCNSSAVATGHDTTLVMGPFLTDPADSTDTFDDIVVYGTRATMGGDDE